MEKFIKIKKRKRKDQSEEEPAKKVPKGEKPRKVSSFECLEETMNEYYDWNDFLQKQFKKQYFKDLKKFLVKEEKKEETIYPPVNDVFNVFKICNLDDIKVVILGQDPYHQPNQAHGLCFSVKKGVKVPPSLRNMYTELENDIAGFERPNHGELTYWAEQGVFLLNDVLTVRRSKAHSHAKKGWEEFTSAVIDHINKSKEGIVFILWGNHAQKKGKSINKKKHLVLKCGHPSPLSVKKFYGCKHFSKANTYLREHSKEPIDWKLI